VAKFTAPVPLNIVLPGGFEIAGAAGATHRIPDALYEEFHRDVEPVIPGGVTWITQDETSGIAGFDPSLKYDKTGGTISGAVTVTGILTALTGRFKGEPFADVKAFGAVGDGTTDDTANIQSAITSAGIGGAILISKGTYKVSSTLSLLDGQTLMGDKAVLIRAASMSVSIASASGVSNITIANLIVDGNGPNTVTNAANMIHLVDVQRPRVVNVRFRSTPSSNPALMLLACNDGLVIGCDFLSTGYGVVIGLNPSDSRTCDRNVVAHCTGQNIPTNALFYSSAIDSSVTTQTIVGNIAIGNSFKSCGDATIEIGQGNRDFSCVGNTIIGGAASRTGILIRDTVGGTVSGNSIKGVRGTNSDGIAVITQNATFISDLAIGPNVARDCARYGLLVQSARRVSITGGVYEGNGDTGVLINNVLDFTVSGVIARSNAAYGFSIGATGASVARGVVTGCIAIDNSSSSTATYDGFLIAGSGTSAITFSGCIATDTATAGKKQRYGLNAFAGLDVNVIGCRFEGNATGRVTNNITTELSIDSGSKSAFPSDPVTNERLYRFDRKIPYFYDGTRWLSQQLFHLAMGPGDILPANSTSSGVTAGRFSPPTQDYDAWLETLYLSSYIVSANTSVAFWSFALQKTDGVTTVAIGTLTTASDANATWISRKLAINALLGTANDIIELNATKTSTPGNWYAAANLAYRLVG
jgi:hypothetical protein